MGGLFGVASKKDCVTDLFFGTDYHSHLGTKRGGMATYGKDGFSRSIHNIENSPFRTKFERDVTEMSGHLGIGCISDTEPQPLIIRTGFGSFAIAAVGRINNKEELLTELLNNGFQFQESSGGRINDTELTAALISTQKSIVEGIRYAGEVIDGSMTLLLMTSEGIYAARDRLGRTPLVVGKNEDGYCVSFESFAYHNFGYRYMHELGPGEIMLITPEGANTLNPPGENMQVCAFLWTYYGYSTSAYEGVNVEMMRYRCGQSLASFAQTEADYVAGVPDSGTAYAISYANASGIPFARPLIKYTPTWPRSFMPGNQNIRNLIARMKLIPVDALIERKRLILIDDSIVRGTQMRETVEYFHANGAKAIHIRSASPPIMYGCRYLNFSRSTSELDLITRRTILKLEGEHGDDTVYRYAKTGSGENNAMVEDICAQLGFTSLSYQKLEYMLDAVGIDKCNICTYCFNGKCGCEKKDKGDRT